jgi:hypothetical protein
MFLAEKNSPLTALILVMLKKILNRPDLKYSAFRRMCGLFPLFTLEQSCGIAMAAENEGAVWYFVPTQGHG